MCETEIGFLCAGKNLKNPVFGIFFIISHCSAFLSRLG